MSATSFDSPAVDITQDLIDTLIERGGYTHPLFNPTPEAKAAHGGPPLPGQGVFLLMGGLVEQSGRLDHAIAMLELRRLTFSKMLTAGSQLSVTITPLESTTTGSGKVVQTYTWSGLDGDGDPVAEAEVVMLMNSLEGTPT